MPGASCGDFRGRRQRSRCLQSIIPEIPRFLGRGGQSEENLPPRPIFTRNLGIIHRKRAFRLFRSTAGSFSCHRATFNRREEVMNHDSSQNRGPRTASRSRCNHGSGQQEEIIRGGPGGGVVRIPETASGPLFFSRWRLGCLVKNSPDRERHRGSAEPRSPPGNTGRCRIPPDEFRARHEAARGHFFHRSARKNRFSAIIFRPAENRMFTDVSGHH